MTESAKVSTSGIIPSPSLSDIFNSPEFQKAKRRALAYQPLKGLRHIPKAPPSPNCGGKAAEAVCKKSQFFADKAKTLKTPAKPAVVAKVKPSAAPAKPAAPAKRAACGAKQAPSAGAAGGAYASVFESAAFQKMRRKALAYDPLKGARHIPKAPPPLLARDGESRKPAHAAKVHGKPRKPKAEPSLTAAYVYTPGLGPQFQPAKIVKDRAQVSALLREGEVGLFSAIAYCDPKGRTHTGTVVEVFSLLPS